MFFQNQHVNRKKYFGFRLLFSLDERLETTKQMVRKFSTFYSKRKTRSTSEGGPQFPNGYSGKLLFHLTLNSLNRNFRIVLAKWQPFVYHLPKFSGNFGRNLKQLGKTILVCPTGTSQKSSPKFPNGISQWKNAVTISAFIYSNVMPSASIEPRKRLLNSVQFLKFPSNSGK